VFLVRSFSKSKLDVAVFRDLNEFILKFRGQSSFLCCRIDRKRVQNPKVSRAWIFWKVVIKLMRQVSKILNYFVQKCRLECFAEPRKHIESFILYLFFPGA